MSFLNKQINFLLGAHALSVILLYTGTSLEFRKISNHSSQLCNLVSLFLYVGVIFSNIQSIYDLEARLNMGECDDFNDKNLKQWILIEILAFVINVIVVFLKLVVGRYCHKNIRNAALKSSVRQSHRIWGILKDETLLNIVEEEVRNEQAFVCGCIPASWCATNFKYKPV